MKYVSLRSLAALTATCRGLRTSVPDSAWQQTAQFAYPAGHPGRNAPCVRQYLRQRHATRRCVAAGRYRLQEHATAEATLSPDLTAHASLTQSDHGSYLRVRELSSGRTLSRIDLPAGVTRLPRARNLLWSPDGSTLVVRFGGEWALEPGLKHAYEVPRGSPGLIFADLESCTSNLVELPSQEPLLRACVPLTCSEISACTKQLLVLHADAEQQRSLSVFDASGAVVFTCAA